MYFLLSWFCNHPRCQPPPSPPSTSLSTVWCETPIRVLKQPARCFSPLPGTQNPPRALCELNDVNLLLEKQGRSIKSGLKVAGAAISGGSASCWPTSTAGLSSMVWSCSWLLKALQRQEHMSMRALENGG